MAAQPDRALIRAVADVVLTEEKARTAADRELEARIERGRERIDEYGNVIETRFLALEHSMRSAVVAHVASLELKDGAPGPAGPPGAPGAPGIAIEGPAGPPGPPGEVGYVGQARGLWNAEAVYRAMDVVSWDGKEWRAIKDNPGPLSNDPAVRGDGWMLSAMRGERGERGLKGERGERGERGMAGASGARGEKGDRGAAGERGLKGDKGDRGEPGPPGVGIKDILEENGLRLLQLTDGREFVLERVA